MNRIYMDNAATSFPKPASVHKAMMRFATEIGASAGRGGYEEARIAGRLIQRCRKRLNRLIGGTDPNHVVFTLNTTDALNIAIRGIVFADARPKHLITTWLDHNSVLRPFNALTRHKHICCSHVTCDPATGLVDPDDISQAIRPETALIAVVHGSNVSGTLQPIGPIGRIARAHGIPFLVDAAQSLGHQLVNVQRDCIDLLAFPGHKGLLGPLGTGGLYIRPGLEQSMALIREGGTGSQSEQDVQPDFMPDRFESGSHNTIGIVGLSEAVAWILDQTIENLHRHEQTLMSIMLDALLDTDRMPGLRLLGPQTIDDRCGVFSVSVDGFDHPQGLADLLEYDYGILSRAGLHCAPLAHQSFSTHSLGGSTRLSFGPFLDKQDVQTACHALGSICREHAACSRISSGG